ncbi:hypothetical protein CBS101457_004455 [Exobasidium rhododendri]|nr:hypothetical protein CBS101457_004455 [Exobasidium rhododendri]
MRRSTRSVKTKPIAIQEASDATASDEESLDLSQDEHDTSEDEWRPEDGKKKGKRRREVADESDESEAGGEEAFMLERDDEIAVGAKPHKAKKLKVVKPKETKSGSRSLSRQAQPSYEVTDDDILAAQAAIEEEAEEEAEEREAERQEAAEMWEQVRERKRKGKGEGADQKKGSKKESPAATTTSASLTSWLRIPEPDWPTTCEDAMINDRDSLFVGFVYALATPSLSIITQYLSHLGKVVHPKAVPTNRLPPTMQHLASNRRGASHDMHAWRCLALKTGRTGLNGPEDFGLEEGLEDDGERFGAKEIAKVIKQLGATDVLVVVSRWYGGTMLGPVRFQHIESCARAALSQYMIAEALLPMKKQLEELDGDIASLRSRLSGSTVSSVSKAQYNDLDVEKGERLIMARKRTIDMLRKRIDVNENSSSHSMPNATTLSSAKEKVGKDVEAVTEKETSPPAADARIAMAPERPLMKEKVLKQPISEVTADQQPLVKEEDIEGDDLTGWDALD